MTLKKILVTQVLKARRARQDEATVLRHLNVSEVSFFKALIFHAYALLCFLRQ